MAEKDGLIAFPLACRQLASVVGRSGILGHHQHRKQPSPCSDHECATDLTSLRGANQLTSVFTSMKALPELAATTNLIPANFPGMFTYVGQGIDFVPHTAMTQTNPGIPAEMVFLPAKMRMYYSTLTATATPGRESAERGFYNDVNARISECTGSDCRQCDTTQNCGVNSCSANPQIPTCTADATSFTTVSQCNYNPLVTVEIQLQQSVHFSGLTAAQYQVGYTSMAYEAGYGKAISTWDASYNSFKIGCSVSSSATGQTEVHFTAIVSNALAASAHAAAQSLTAGQLEAEIAAAITQLQVNVTAPQITSVGSVNCTGASCHSAASSSAAVASSSSAVAPPSRSVDCSGVLPDIIIPSWEHNNTNVNVQRLADVKACYDMLEVDPTYAQSTIDKLHNYLEMYVRTSTCCTPAP